MSAVPINGNNRRTRHSIPIRHALQRRPPLRCLYLQVILITWSETDISKFKKYKTRPSVYHSLVCFSVLVDRCTFLILAFPFDTKITVVSYVPFPHFRFLTGFLFHRSIIVEIVNKLGCVLLNLIGRHQCLGRRHLFVHPQQYFQKEDQSLLLLTFSQMHATDC